MEKVLSSEELAKNVCTNPVLVRKTMSKLKKAGIVDTKGGNAGGYRFTDNAKTLTLEKIANVLDIHFVSSPWRSKDVDKECLISSGMGDVIENIFAQLDEQCKRVLRGITIADVEQKLLKQGKELNVGQLPIT